MIAFQKNDLVVLSVVSSPGRPLTLGLGYQLKCQFIEAAAVKRWTIAMEKKVKVSLEVKAHLIA